MSKEIKKLLVPKLRFPEFRDAGEWEDVKLGDITTSIKSGLGRQLSLQDIGLPVINSANLTTRGLDTRELKYWYVDDPQGAKTKNYFLEDGDILLNFINSISQIGKSCIFRSFVRPCIFTTNILRIRVRDDYDPEFVHSLMLDSRFQLKIRLITRPAVNQASFTKADLSRIALKIPPLPEQKTIADCLSSVDELITTQTQKIDALKAHKKGLMQKLFPAEGETVPKLRFPKFRDAGEWEDVRLREVVKKVAMGPFGSNIKVETFKAEGIPIISGQHLHEVKLRDNEFNFITEEHADKLSNSNVFRGDVVLTHAGNIGQVSFIPKTSRYDRYVLSQRQFYLRCDQEKIDHEFIAYYFRSPYGQHQILANSGQTGVPSLAQPATSIKNLNILIPPLPEQKTIADCLSSIDELITTQTQKIDALKAHKKGLMQQLFPSY